MSGIEVVGLVLGGLPLLISAAEHYQKGFEPLEKWYKFRTQFMSFVNAVDIQQQLFNLTLECFLRSIDIEEDEINRFMGDSNYEGWQRPDLRSRISSRLGPSLGVFMSTINSMNDLVLELEDLLLIKNGDVQWLKDGASKWDYQLYRMRHSFSKKGTRAVESLKYQNKILQDLIDSNEKLSIQKAKRKDTTWATIFECIRRHASSVHAALRTSWTCQCAPHTASLRLEQRKTGDWDSSFNLAFGVPKDQKTVRREVTIRIRKDKTVQGGTKCSIKGSQGMRDNARRTQAGLNSLRQNFELKASPLPNAISRPILPTTASAPSTASPYTSFKGLFRNSSTNGTDCLLEGEIRGKQIKPKTKKTVRLDVPVDLPLRSVSTPSLQTQLQVIGADQVAEIRDLCSTIRSNCLIDDCLGYLSDGEHMHELRPVPTSEETDESTYISLEDILSNQTGGRLSQRKRFKLASILASSLLQLQTTPWLIEKFEKRNIFFYQRQTTVMIDYPYIKHSFPSEPPTNTTPSHPINPRFVTRDSLSNLGILLLELYFGQPIEDQEVRQEHLGPDGKPHQGTDYMTARDWVEMMWDEEPKLGSIIRSCLYCMFEEKPDWHNKVFTQAVYSSVVGPLDDYFVSKWP